MRGEKVFECLCKAGDLGSPPRARGKEYKRLLRRIADRITPACAGKS